MRPLYSVQIPTDHGAKEIAVYSCNILDFDENIDILTTSARTKAYYPSYGSMFWALESADISVERLSRSPRIDLRDLCNVWLSRHIDSRMNRIHRIGCVEFSGGYYRSFPSHERSVINSIKSYFCMLDIASINGIKMETLALPLLGSGVQHYSADLIIVPLLNECLSFLNRNPAVKRILFIEYDPHKARLIEDYLRKSYRIESTKHVPAPRSAPAQTGPVKAVAFISHSSRDADVTKLLCAKLEKQGVKVWYAPRDVFGAYAASIVNGIRDSTHFIVLTSRNSMCSQHVLNEIDLAFNDVSGRLKIKPLRIDDTPFTAEFEYYLSRFHWMDAIIPPLEDRLDEFVEKFMRDL